MTDPLQTLLACLHAPLPAIQSDERIDLDSNHVMHMDNLEAIARIPPGEIDFIYIDPPFASDATYSHRVSAGSRVIERAAYNDSWPDGLGSYLEFLVPRLRAMRALLKPTGSICVHLDNHSSHYIKLALDAIFGQDLLINEVIWRYGKMSNTTRRFPQNHDTLLVYGASPNWYFAPVFNAPSEYRQRFLRDLTDNQVLFGTVKHRTDKLLLRRIALRKRELGRDLNDDDVLFDFDRERKVQDDVFTDISIIRGNAHEGVGYATQKPAALLQRLISAFCPPGGVVADFFGGSGSTAIAAHATGRRFIVADAGQPAIGTMRKRLAHIPYELVHTLPLDTFFMDRSGSIVDFRLDALQLSDADCAWIKKLLIESPEVLLVQHTEPQLDIFGREATLLP